MAERELQGDSNTPLVQNSDLEAKMYNNHPKPKEESSKNKKSDRKMSEEMERSIKYYQDINSSFRSNQSGDDLENKLSSSSEGDVQRGLEIYHKKTWVDDAKHFARKNWIKILTVTLLFVGQLIVKFAGMIQDKDVEKPEDTLQNLTEGINRFAVDNIAFGKAWQIVCSLSLDIQFFLVLFFWLWKGYSFRVVIALLLFYAIRAVLQAIFILPFPDLFYWDYPGFPSLMNMYGRQSDFFYSGHVGFSLLCTIENFRCKVKWAGFFGVFATAFQTFTLLVFRVHYTIDLFTGLVMCHYCFYLAGFVSDWVDKCFLNQEVLNQNPNFRKVPTAQTKPLLAEDVSNTLKRKRYDAE